METQELLELSGVILGSLGGGAAIIFGFSSWLGKVWANRLMTKEKAEYAQELESLRNRLTQDTESYKIKLKKSEFLFQKEYEAASEFVALKWSFLPTYSHPGMDWHEACDEIAHNFHKIEKSLGAYVSKHGAVLKHEVQNHIGNAIGLAGENKFEVTSPEVPDVANKAASDIFGEDGELDKAEKLLLNQVHSQSST
jgi:hypothetical protein